MTIEMFEKIIPVANATDLVQILAFMFNLLYVVLASRGNVWCWVSGFIGTLFQFFVCIEADLKSDAALQVYYLFSAIYGWLSWQNASNKSDFVPTSYPLSIHAQILGIGILISLPLGLIWTTAAFRYEDAALTVFSIVTTFLTARKILESWLYWLLIDASYAYIFWERDKSLLAILSLAYLVFSIRGYFEWKKKSIAIDSF